MIEPDPNTFETPCVTFQKCCTLPTVGEQVAVGVSPSDSGVEANGAGSSLNTFYCSKKIEHLGRIPLSRDQSVVMNMIRAL